MIDINCDLGEGLDNEKELMPYISSCNISCGAHAGSIETIDKVLLLAKQHNVKIGAHPSYPDKENFGRKIMNISDDELKESLFNQLELFKQRAEFQEVEVHHVKPHGALYNLIAVDAVKAQLVVDVIKEVFGKMMIYVPYNSKIEKVALNNKLPVFYEAFADRNYNDDLSLVSRTESNAVLVNSNEVVEHVFRILEGNVLTVQENLKPIKADTLCIHGDNPNVLKILKSLHQHFN